MQKIKYRFVHLNYKFYLEVEERRWSVWKMRVNGVSACLLEEHSSWRIITTLYMNTCILVDKLNLKKYINITWYNYMFYLF